MDCDVGGEGNGEIGGGEGGCRVFWDIPVELGVIGMWSGRGVEGEKSLPYKLRLAQCFSYLSRFF